MEPPMRRRTFLASLACALAAPCAAAQPHPQPPTLTLFAEEPARFSAAMPTVPHFTATRRRQTMRVWLGDAFARRILEFELRFEPAGAAPAVLHAARSDTGPTGVVMIVAERAEGWPAGPYAVVVSERGRAVARLPYRVVP